MRTTIRIYHNTNFYKKQTFFYKKRQKNKKKANKNLNCKWVKSEKRNPNFTISEQNKGLE